MLHKSFENENKKAFRLVIIFLIFFVENTNDNYSSKISIQKNIHQTRQSPGRFIKPRVVIITPLLISAGILIASIHLNG